MPSPYNPPSGNAANFNFARTPYTAPGGNSTNFPFGAAPNGNNGNNKKHHVLAEMERPLLIEDEFFPIFTKRVFTVAPLPVPNIKPHHHAARYEEPEPDWAPLIRAAAQGPQPAPPRVKLWHHAAFFEETDLEPAAIRRSVSIAPLPVPPRYRPWWHGAVHEEVAEQSEVPLRRPGTPPAPPPPPVVILSWRPSPIFVEAEAAEEPTARRAPFPLGLPPRPWHRPAFARDEDEPDFRWRFTVAGIAPAPAPAAIAVSAARLAFLAEEDEPPPFARRALFPLGLPPLPWHRPAFARDEDEADFRWRFTVAGIAPAPAPAAIAVSAARLAFLAEDDEPPPFSAARRVPPFPASTPPRQRLWLVDDEDAPPFVAARFAPPAPPPPPQSALPYRATGWVLWSLDEAAMDWSPQRRPGFVVAPTPPPAAEPTERYFIANMGRFMNRP